MNFISVLRTEKKLISVVWSYDNVILKLLHCKIKLILGKMKPHANSLLEKLVLGSQKILIRSCSLNTLFNF